MIDNIKLTKLLLDVSYNMISDVVVNIDDGNPLTKNDYDKIYCVRDCISELLKIYRDKPKNAPPVSDNSNGDYCQLTNDVICPKCGSKMNKKEGIVLTSNPPQYVYNCPKCGLEVTKMEQQITNHPHIYNNCGTTSEPFEPLASVNLSKDTGITKVSLASMYGEMNNRIMALNSRDVKLVKNKERNTEV